MSKARKEELFDAVQRNDENAVKQLVEEKGIPVTSINGMDQTVAHVAAKNGNLNILKYVSDKDPSILAVVDFHGESVIFFAIDGGHLDIVKYLVEARKTDIAQPHDGWFGNSAIHKAAECGELAILKYFLNEKNGDVNIVNKLQQTPLFLAAECKHHDVIKYLVEEKNAEVTRIDYRKCNILYIAIDNDDLKLLKYFLDEKNIGFDINWTDESDLTLVHRAAILNRFDLLKYLVGEKHADVNIPDKWGQTPLHSAARWNYYDACKYLIEKGAKMQVESHRGKLPIQEASDQYLIDYMKNASALVKRKRRSAPESIISGFTSSHVQWLHLIKGNPMPLAWASLGSRSSSAHKTNIVSSAYIQSFLIIARTFLNKRIKGYNYSEGGKYTPFPTSINESFVARAIRALPHFKEHLEN